MKRKTITLIAAVLLAVAPLIACANHAGMSAEQACQVDPACQGRP